MTDASYGAYIMIYGLSSVVPLVSHIGTLKRSFKWPRFIGFVLQIVVSVLILYALSVYETCYTYTDAMRTVFGCTLKPLLSFLFAIILYIIALVLQTKSTATKQTGRVNGP